MTEADKFVTTEELFASKGRRRQHLANLPIEEKLQILLKLQQIASTIGKSAGRKTKEPWNISSQ